MMVKPVELYSESLERQRGAKCLKQPAQKLYPLQEMSCEIGRSDGIVTREETSVFIWEPRKFLIPITSYSLNLCDGPSTSASEAWESSWLKPLKITIDSSWPLNGQQGEDVGN